MPTIAIARPKKPKKLSRRQHFTRLMASLLGLSLCWGGLLLHPRSARADSPETAPPELKALIEQIDAAANRQDLRRVMQFYSRRFTHSDGLTYNTLEKALQELWERYPNIKYRTEILSWEEDGNEIVAETATKIMGVETLADRDMALTATVRSRQRYRNEQLVRQDILAENTQVVSGQNPPELMVNLPEEVGIGQRFAFDAIVEKPLGDDLLLGGALEETTTADTYFTPTNMRIETLSAGGIFKVGQAPALPETRWISAILIRHDGITMITRRLRAIAKHRLR